MTDEPDDEELKNLSATLEIARGVMKKRWRVFRALAQIDAGAARHEVEAQLAVGQSDETTDYRLDPEKPRQLTPEEEERLNKTRIDYSDIPPLGDEFFSKAARSAPKPRS